jgi:Na+-translocating ferredoxin:NAD+ oxidoreductase RnfG subunit
LSAEQAQRLLFPAAERFEASSIKSGASEQPLWRAMRGDAFLGFFIVDEVIGKHELITYAVALDAQGVVRGVEILDYRESRGGEVRDPRWRAQFVGKGVGDPLRLGEDIQNLSGATLSSRHITDGVRRLVAVVKNR